MCFARSPTLATMRPSRRWGTRPCGGWSFIIVWKSRMCGFDGPHIQPSDGIACRLALILLRTETPFLYRVCGFVIFRTPAPLAALPTECHSQSVTGLRCRWTSKLQSRGQRRPRDPLRDERRVPGMRGRIGNLRANDGGAADSIELPVMSNVRKTGSIGMFRNEFVEAGTTGTRDVTNDGESVGGKGDWMWGSRGWLLNVIGFECQARCRLPFVAPSQTQI